MLKEILETELSEVDTNQCVLEQLDYIQDKLGFAYGFADVEPEVVGASIRTLFRKKSLHHVRDKLFAEMAARRMVAI